MPITPDLVEVNLGTVTSYGLALANGFTGTHEEWVQKIIGGASQADLDALAAEVHYVALAINSFTVTPSTAEIGSTVSSVALAFTISKIPTKLYLDNVEQTPAKTGTISRTGQTITQDKTYTLKATDEKNPNGVTKTAKISFYNRICWGAAAAPGTVNSEFLLGLANAILSGTKGRTINKDGASDVNAGSGEYIWYAVPKRLGACSFKVGGFAGGFEAAQTVSVTNDSGYTEDYYVYRSTNAALGHPEIVVT